ncbi:hypothetical protein [Nonomuraea sp. NPDC049028]|uniref:hypothetical protein n=1 Tax=Nonomuraea sp. NPDC049028 TaxID=3364348 RepID=UPI003724736C
MNPETKTGRRQLARKARQFGYFDIPAGPGQWRKYEVNCPLCNERVSAAWESGTTRIALLDGAMDAHLLRDCEHGPQQ